MGFLQDANEMVCDFYIVPRQDVFAVQVLPSDVFLVQDEGWMITSWQLKAFPKRKSKNRSRAGVSHLITVAWPLNHPNDFRVIIQGVPSNISSM